MTATILILIAAICGLVAVVCRQQAKLAELDERRAELLQAYSHVRQALDDALNAHAAATDLTLYHTGIEFQPDGTPTDPKQLQLAADVLRSTENAKYCLTEAMSDLKTILDQ